MPFTVATPELEKMSASRERSQPIGEFIDWLAGQGIFLMRSVPIVHQRWPWESRYDVNGKRTWGPHRGPDDGVHGPPEQYERGEEAVMYGESIERMLARFFDIDLNVIEEERRALLDAIREANA